MKTIYLMMFFLVASSGYGLRMGDTVQNWLYNQTIVVPDVQAEKLGLQITVSNLTCTQIWLDGLSSNFDPTLRTLSLSSSGLSLACAGLWVYSEVLVPELIKGNGWVSFRVNPSSGSFTVSLAVDGQGLPSRIELPKCSLSVHLGTLQFGGGIVAKVLEVLRSPLALAITGVLDAFGCSILRTFLKTTVADLLAELDSHVARYMVKPTPATPPDVPAGAPRLRGNPLVGALDYFLDDLSGLHGMINMSMLVSHLTNGTGFVEMDWPMESPLAQTLAVPLLGNLSIALRALSLGNLTAWTNVSLLVPTAPYTLSSDLALPSLSATATLGVCAAPLGCTPLPASCVAGLVGLDSCTPLGRGGTVVEQPMVVALKLGAVDVDALVQVIGRSGWLPSLTPQQVLTPGCIIETVEHMNATLLTLNTTVNELRVTFPGTPPGFEEDLDASINNVVALLLVSCSKGVTSLLAGLVDGPVRELVNTAIDDVTSNATCASVAGESTELDLTVTIAALSTVAFVFVLLLLLLRRSKSPEKNGILAPLMLPPLAESINDALVRQSCLPAVVRVGVVFAILSNGALFFIAVLSTGAEVVTSLGGAGKPIQTPAIESFSIFTSVQDMWDASVYPLAFLVAIFSGGWPFLKTVLLLAAWLIPASVFPFRYRENLLRVLDALGKYALVDNYITTVMSVAFYIHVPIPAVPEAETAEGAASITVEVVPTPGVILFVTATLFSLVLTHVVLYCHRYVEECYTMRRLSRCSVQSSDVTEVSVPTRMSSRPFCLREHVVVFTTRGQRVVTAILAMLVPLMVGGLAIVVVILEFKGLVGKALPVLGVPAIRYFTVIGLMIDIPSCSSYPHSPELVFFQVIFGMFTIVVPLVFLVSCVVLWLWPLSYRHQRLFFRLVEILNAWSATEVFGLSIVTAVLELEQFSRFTLSETCKPLDEILVKYFSSELGDQAFCFSAKAMLADGAPLLMLSTMLYVFFGNGLLILCHRMLERANPTFNPEQSKIDQPRASYMVNGLLRIGFIEIVDTTSPLGNVLH